MRRAIHARGPGEIQVAVGIGQLRKDPELTGFSDVDNWAGSAIRRYPTQAQGVIAIVVPGNPTDDRIVVIHRSQSVIPGYATRGDLDRITKRMAAVGRQDRPDVRFVICGRDPGEVKQLSVGDD